MNKVSFKDVVNNKGEVDASLYLKGVKYPTDSMPFKVKEKTNDSVTIEIIRPQKLKPLTIKLDKDLKVIESDSVINIDFYKSISESVKQIGESRAARLIGEAKKILISEDANLIDREAIDTVVAKLEKEFDERKLNSREKYDRALAKVSKQTGIPENIINKYCMKTTDWLYSNQKDKEVSKFIEDAFIAFTGLGSVPRGND